uniref:Uncharacterized protein n=2 Tax=Meloidogyne incognita TaxID=6306 RepID=A0A914KPS9_MELIC
MERSQTEAQPALAERFYAISQPMNFSTDEHVYNNNFSGISAHFTSGMRRAVLRSPNFRISLNSQIEMHLIASLSTFGSRLYICPNDQQQQTQRKLLAEIETMVEGMFVEEDDTLKELGNCEPLLGPKVVRSKMEHLIIQLDPEIRHFSLVAIHDKFEQFGDAQILIHSIKLNDLNGQSIC